MYFASAITINHHLDEAIRELTTAIHDEMNGLPIDVLWVFASAFFLPSTTKVAHQLNSALSPRHTIGLTATGVIGDETELEAVPAISIVAAHLPEVTVTPFILNGAALSESLANPQYFKRQIGTEDADIIFVFTDAFTTPIDDVLTAFNRDYEGVPVVGGVASASSRIGGNALIIGDDVLNVGAIGLVLQGALDVDVIVSQGCRPIGRTMTVTDAQANVIFGLDGQSPAPLIRDLYQMMTHDEQDLFQESGIFIGRAMRSLRAYSDNLNLLQDDDLLEATNTEAPDELIGRGDFLVRNVVGVERETGALIVGDTVTINEHVQFHLRDAQTAEEDLDMLLIPQSFRPKPAGALLFSCVARGNDLYLHPDGDIKIINQSLGIMPLAGFFANGELGPVGGRNFLHEQTASLVVFRPKG